MPMHNGHLKVTLLGLLPFATEFLLPLHYNE